MALKRHFLFSLLTFYICLQVMKTYHMYHSESISAESKLKEAEKQEEKQIGRGDPVFSIRMEDKYQRRSSVKKIEKMKEKVGHQGSTAPDCQLQLTLSSHHSVLFCFFSSLAVCEWLKHHKVSDDSRLCVPSTALFSVTSLTND